MLNFWQELPTPVFMLAPMDDVTDTVFREVVLSVSSADILKVLFTEFVSTDALVSQNGFQKAATRLNISSTEKQLLLSKGIKIVVQIWGNNPEHNYKTAHFISSLGVFDGIDINMGCPVKKVVKKGCCSALIQQPELAGEIIQACKEGSTLPISVKTRIGYKTIETEPWIQYLLESDIAALTIHGRTQKMQSYGEANWDEIEKGVAIRDRLQKKTRIFGNGDVSSYQDGLDRINKYKVDGVMVGTGIFNNPWFFRSVSDSITFEDRLTLMKKHIDLFFATWGGDKRVETLKRFFKIYVNGFQGAAASRDRLMNTANAKDIYNEFERLMKGNG